MFAVKPDLIQGATIADKMQTAVSAAGIVDFVRKARDAESGFWCTHDQEGGVLFLPSGYMYIMIGQHSNDVNAGHEGAEGLRWSRMDLDNREDVAVAQQNVAASMDCFPDLHRP